MQCMWYELEVARAHRALSHYGEALKKAQQIEQVWRIRENYITSFKCSRLEFSFLD